MGKIYFISHPEVVIDPAIPVPLWRLSEHGIKRMRSFASQPELQSITSIWSSTETKAIEAAEILAGVRGKSLSTDTRFNEIGRSATGFVPAEEHEIITDRFFSASETSICGWERAVDVQQRIVEGFEAVRRPGASGDIAIVGHGGAGTLLLCFLAGLPIGRQHDQPFQGHYWCYSSEDNAVLHHWKPIAPR